MVIGEPSTGYWSIANSPAPGVAVVTGKDLSPEAFFAGPDLGLGLAIGSPHGGGF